MKNDELIMAIKKGGYKELKNATPEQLENEEIMKIAYRMNIRTASKYIPDKLLDKKEFVRELIKINGTGFKLEKINERYGNDREIAEESLENGESTWYYFGDELKNDRELAIKALSKDANIYQNMKFLHSDEEATKIAVKADGNNLKYTSLNENEEIVDLAMHEDKRAYKYAGTKYRSTNRDAALKAVRYDGSLLQFVEGELREDESISLAALTASIDQDEAFQYLSTDLSNKESFLNEAKRRIEKIIEKERQRFDEDSDNLWRKELQDEDTIREVFENSFEVRRYLETLRQIQDKLQQIKQVNDNKEQTESDLTPYTHDISEIEEATSDRRLENINNVTETIHNQVRSNERENGNQAISPDQETK